MVAVLGAQERPGHALGALCRHDGKDAATKIFRSIFSISRIAIAIAFPTGHMCINQRSLRSAVTLVGGRLEYECLGTRIGRARCGARAPLGSHDEEDGGRMVANGDVQVRGAVFDGNKI